MRDHVVYESRLELARLIFADFDRAVHRILAQPGDVHEIAVAYPSVAWVPPVPSALTPGTARACPQVPPGRPASPWRPQPGRSAQRTHADARENDDDRGSAAHPGLNLHRAVPLFVHARNL